MKVDDRSTIYFYSSGVKLLFWFILTWLIDMFICVAAFREGHTPLGVVCTFIAQVLFGFIGFIIIKGIWNPNPYLILTENALIVSAIVRNKTTAIEWDDIIGYNVRNRDFRKFIEVILYDEKKYLDKKFNRKQATYKTTYEPLFSIGWGLIKPRDRRLLAYEMDKRTKRGFQLTHELFPQTNTDQHERPRAYHPIDKKYILKSYIFSLILAGFTAFLFSWDSSKNEDTSFIVVSFILYPFAKVFFDGLLGFRINDKLANQEGLIVQRFYGLLFLVHLGLFMISLYLAPFGMLYLITRGVAQYIKRKKNGG